MAKRKQQLPNLPMTFDTPLEAHQAMVDFAATMVNLGCRDISQDIDRFELTHGARSYVTWVDGCNFYLDILGPIIKADIDLPFPFVSKEAAFMHASVFVLGLVEQQGWGVTATANNVLTLVHGRDAVKVWVDGATVYLHITKGA
jgi:hypothetical protein